jgi:hypothetical protein
MPPPRAGATKESVWPGWSADETFGADAAAATAAVPIMAAAIAIVAASKTILGWSR